MSMRAQASSPRLLAQAAAPRMVIALHVHITVHVHISLHMHVTVHVRLMGGVMLALRLGSASVVMVMVTLQAGRQAHRHRAPAITVLAPISTNALPKPETSSGSTFRDQDHAAPMIT